MQTHPLSEAHRVEIKSWSYVQELNTYSGEGIAPDNPAFFAVSGGSTLMGFGVTGFDAIVQGMEEYSSDLEVGLGMAPDFIGNGRGMEFLQTVLKHATKLAEMQGRSHLRCAIYSWNKVSQLMASRAGFEASGTITNDLGEFIIMRKRLV